MKKFIFIIVAMTLLFVLSGCAEKSQVSINKPTDAPILENKAFKIESPKSNQIVKNNFTVKGKARVFEASFAYAVKDGDTVLAEGFVMADQGAPEWGNFTFEVKLKKQPTSSQVILSVFENSAKDGMPVNVLNIPLKLEAVK